MDILIQIILLIIGFALLIKGADWFVDGASALAAKFGIPPLVIGLTIVAMGTSAPEAAISITSACKGSADIAVGNVLGSNIMNILVILGVTAIITPLAVQKTTLRYEIPFVIAITAIFGILGLVDNTLTILDGVILCLLFVAYLTYLFIMTKKGKIAQEEDEILQGNVTKLLILGVVGIAMVILGSNITIDAASEIARAFGMSERFIGLTIVAFGSSLPELVTSVSAGLKKKADIAVGNIVGSNIFNILFVIGISALITPVAYQEKFMVDTIICVATSLLLLFCVLNKDNKLKRASGIIMLVGYAAYFAYLICT